MVNDKSILQFELVKQKKHTQVGGENSQQQ